MLGFGLWNIDNVYCDRLKKIRGVLGLAAPLTQLHAWWHLLAGYATHLHIQSCILQRALFLNEDIMFRMSWIGIIAERPALLAKDERAKKSN